jgi:hypothetical protein
MDMTKTKKPVVDADPKAIARWDSEGGAPASGDRSTVKRPKRPRDTNQIAKFIVDVATGEIDVSEAPKVARARKAGAVGGPARAKALTPAQRSEIASLAASARWKKG